MRLSPYQIEDMRGQLASRGELAKLKDLYSPRYPEITHAVSWEIRHGVRPSLCEEGEMTQERVKLADSFIPQTARRILDIGIGAGWVEELLEQRNVTLYGNDISPQAIRNVQARFKGHFTVQSLYSLTYKKSFFDAVLLLEVLEHVPPSKTFDVLRSVSNLLKVGGHFILSVPTNEGLENRPDNPSGHVRMYTVPLICSELKLSGFAVLQVRTLYAFRRFYRAKKLLAAIMPHRWQPNDIIVQAQKR
jgi:2-polyprenyl-3-methyl-5-hydroxy-6-metoxy-1,4-benzoquinol methylase